MNAVPLIIGIGNSRRGDDGAGPAVIAELEQNPSSQYKTTVCQGDLTRLMELWRDHTQVVLVDMVQIAGEEPGSVHRFDVSHDALPYTLSHSSHTLSLTQCIELARALEQLPQQISIVGIVGADASLGNPLSDAVEHAVHAVSTELRQAYTTQANSHA